jgi:hypothetical protein
MNSPSPASLGWHVAGKDVSGNDCIRWRFALLYGHKERRVSSTVHSSQRHVDEPHRTHTDRSRVGEMILGWGRRNHSRSIHVRKRDRLARRYDNYSVASNFKGKNN